MKTQDTLSPRAANTFNKVCSLQSDNKSAGKADLMVHEDRVSIYPDNGTTKGWVTISKRDFNKLIDWYNSPQKLRKD